MTPINLPNLFNIWLMNRTPSTERVRRATAMTAGRTRRRWSSATTTSAPPSTPSTPSCQSECQSVQRVSVDVVTVTCKSQKLIFTVLLVHIRACNEKNWELNLGVPRITLYLFRCPPNVIAKALPAYSGVRFSPNSGDDFSDSLGLIWYYSVL